MATWIIPSTRENKKRLKNSHILVHAQKQVLHIRLSPLRIISLLYYKEHDRKCEWKHIFCNYI